MKIRILCVGKIKEKFMREALGEYSKRLSRYIKLEITEVVDEKTPDSASEKEENQIRDKEAERLLKQIRQEDYVIALAIDGKMYDSVAFSKKLDRFGVLGRGSVVFVIGDRKSVVRERVSASV